MAKKSSAWVGYAVSAAILFFASAGLAEPPTQDEGGTVSGVTLFVVKGHPGALIGKPDPDYRAPEPKIAPNEKLFWLRIDRETGHQLFIVQSDGDGRYQITLPRGEYCVEPASRHEATLKQTSLQQRNDQDVLIKMVFPSWRVEGKPDLRIEKNLRYRMDVEARILFID